MPDPRTHEPSPGPGRAVRPAWRRAGTVYLIGVDAMTMDVIGPLVRGGELPHFARLMAEGSHGLLQTIPRVQSALIWATIATGRHERDHGIDAFAQHRLLGLPVSASTVSRLKRLGFRLPWRVLQSLGLVTRRRYTTQDVRAKTIWDLVSEAGGRVGVANWLNTWPAYPVNGFLVSDRLYSWRLAALGIEDLGEERLVFPPSLSQEVRGLMVPPGEVPVELLQQRAQLPIEELRDTLSPGEFDKRDVRAELRYCVSADLSIWRALEHCLGRFAPLSLVATTFGAMDTIQHAAFRYLPSVNDPAVSEEDRRRFGRVVPESYAFVDRILGSLLARMGQDDSLVVVSDHGFGPQRGRTGYGHKRSGPPGVFFARGAEFLPGHAVQGAHVADVMPTVMRICGFPLARDLVGRPLEDALTPAFRSEHPAPEPVPTYGVRSRDYSALPGPDVGP